MHEGPPAGELGLVLGKPPAAAVAAAGGPAGTTDLPTGIPGPGTTSGITAWLTATASGAEECGAGAIWAVDHLFWGSALLECMTTLAVVAGATSSATVGTCVLQLPLRSPAAVAKQASALQLLSGGRMVLGVGAGSHRQEYELAGCNFSTRGRQLDAGIAELRRAWATAGDTATPYRQEPAGAPVPLWIGGSSAAARRRAATLGDGWIPLFVSAAELGDGLARLADEAVAAGRRPDAVSGAVVVPVAVGDDRDVTARGCAWLADLYGIPPRSFERHLVAGPAAACAESVRAYLDAGASHVAVLVAGDNPLDHFAPLAEALAPSSTNRPRLAGVGA